LKITLKKNPLHIERGNDTSEHRTKNRFIVQLCSMGEASLLM